MGRKKCGKSVETCDTERKPESTEHGVRNGNSYGLDSLIKFSIHIHSFARRKSVQVASSLVLPVASFDGERRRKRVLTRVPQIVWSHVFVRNDLSFSGQNRTAIQDDFVAAFLKTDGQSDAHRRPPFYGRVHARFPSLCSTLSENKISNDRSQRRRGNDIFNRAPVAYVVARNFPPRKFSLPFFRSSVSRVLCYAKLDSDKVYVTNKVILMKFTKFYKLLRVTCFKQLILLQLIN